MTNKDIKVCYGVDIDAVAGWLGRPTRANSFCDISRGVWTIRVGIPNLFDLFRRYNIKTTCFTPGHTIETFPNECERLVEEGHEFALHGYSHENVNSMNSAQEEKVLVHTINIIKNLTGKRPTGYRSPSWEFSPVTADLLVKHGILYDSSLMHDDFEAYYIRTGDKWYTIDYNKDPETWMKPMEFGKESSLIEIPANWYLDDFPPATYVRNYSGNTFGWVSPDVLLKIWQTQFDFIYRKGKGVFPLTVHPDTSGRPQMIIMLHERLIPYMLNHPGVSFSTYEEYAKDWKNKNPQNM